MLHNFKTTADIRKSTKPFGKIYISLTTCIPPGPVLAGDGCGAPEVPNAGTVSSFLGPKISTRPLVPSSGCRWWRLDYTNAEPKGKVEQWGRAPCYKTQAVVPPRQRVEAPRYKPRAVVTLKLWMETPQHKTWVIVTSGCR